eukprot:6512074-Ditylum_brightwellii.AAC.1
MEPIDDSHKKNRENIVLKAIINAEDMSQMWKKICFADKGQKENNLTSIQVPVLWPEALVEISPQHDLEDPKLTTEWKTVDLPQELLHYLKIQHRRHFGQAHGTPFTVTPFSQCFDWSENSPISELVLQGGYTNDKIDNITRLFLKHCAAESIDHKIGDKITQE